LDVSNGGIGKAITRNWMGKRWIMSAGNCCLPHRPNISQIRLILHTETRGATIMGLLATLISALGFVDSLGN